jgi:hypothetical protein
MKGRRFKRSMLEYSKIILAKMIFDKELFRKEYSKAIKHLTDVERMELRAWTRTALRGHLAPVEA